jgi:CheY-like chemotaxis protein
MAPAFVIVEDDHLQAAPLADYLEATFPGADVTTLGSEHEFREHLPRMRDFAPDLVLLDVMLRWTFASPTAPAPPDDVAAGGYYRAGLRCANLLNADKHLRHVPVVLYTILERSDLERDHPTLPPNSSYVGKSSEIDVLIRKVRSLVGSRA